MSIEGLAAGKVAVGYSKPYIALYNVEGTTVSYTGAMLLARGVEVNIAPNAPTENTFYADNVAAESDNSFTGGTLSLTVDGLLKATAALAEGTHTVKQIEIPSANGVEGGTVDVTHYNDKTSAPYLGFGCIIKYQSNGVELYTPVVLTKIKFDPKALQSATQAGSKNWQTQVLTAQIFRDDGVDHDWKLVADDQTSEAAAEAIIQALLGGVATAATNTTSTEEE